MGNQFSEIPSDLYKLDNYLDKQESQYDLKEGTKAQIIWNSPEPKQTEYAIIYLHGFRATHPEGDPTHRKVADHFGYNLFLSRLEEHGINSDFPLLHLTEKKLLDSARFAFEIGKKIGKKIIMMGTSTGASLALWLASQSIYKDKISALILYSPLIRFYGINQYLLLNSFTRNSLELVLGEKYLIKEKNSSCAEDRIWHNTYTLKAALTLGAFVEHHMQDETFSNVECPVFTGYYYKNRHNQDNVVSVSAIKEMVSELTLQSELITTTNFPEANTHVICSSLLSNCVGKVITETINFLKNIGSQGTSEN